jgi:hypothetical protein
VFETYASGHRVSWSRRAWVVGSLAVHAIVFVGVLAYVSLRVDELTPPIEIVHLLSAPTQPPPPPAAAAAPSPTVTTRVHKKTIVQPNVSEAPIAPASPSPSAAGVVVGTVDGVAGGVVGSSGAAPMGGATKPKIVPPHALDAQAIYRPDPDIPAAIRSQHRGGEATFTAKVCVAREGNVSSVDVRDGIDGADDAITATIMKWRYQPQPIPVCFVCHWLFTFE